MEPDLFYVSATTEVASAPEHLTTADLVIEVISPGSAIYDRNTKADTYAALGVKELWLVDQVAETGELRTLKDNRFDTHAVFSTHHLLKSVILPGVTIEVRKIFED